MGLIQRMKKYTPDIIWFTVLSLLFHQSGYLMFMFMVPLQAIRNRKDFRTFFTSSSAVLAGILIMVIVRTSGMTDLSTRGVLVFSEFLVPAFLLSGFMYINYNWPGNPGMLKRMVVVTAGALVVGIPVVLFFNNQLLQAYYREQIAFALDIINKTFSEIDSVEMGEMAEVIKSINVDMVAGGMKRTFLRGYLFAYFLIISGSWWLGSSGFKKGRWKSSFHPASFKVPEVMVWPLILSLLAVVVDYKVSIGALGYAGWNILLIMVTLYGFKGLGIIYNFMKIHKFPHSMRVLVIFTIILFLLQPGIKYFVLIGVPCLGVSEIWIKYRKT